MGASALPLAKRSYSSTGIISQHSISPLMVQAAVLCGQTTKTTSRGPGCRDLRRFPKFGNRARDRMSHPEYSWSHQ